MEDQDRYSDYVNYKSCKSHTCTLNTIHWTLIVVDDEAMHSNSKKKCIAGYLYLRSYKIHAQLMKKNKWKNNNSWLIKMWFF